MIIPNGLIHKLPKFFPQKRTFWSWLNKTFNTLDEERLRLFGPDRTCAEWILRNGGQVKFISENEYLTDYNKLPPEGQTAYIQEVDASESSIAHYGFIHFKGCKHIEKVILHKCNYILDEAFEGLKYLNDTLVYLQVSSCANVTDAGLVALKPLKNLKSLLIFDLPFVKNKEAIVNELRKSLPNCNISFK